MRMTGSADDAADITQQAFCKAIENWDTYAHKGLPTTWLYRILVNCVRDWIRRKSTRRAEQFDEWSLMIAADGGQPAADRLQKEEQMAALRNAVESLSKTVRYAFIATVIDGFSYQQAAEILGVPVGTVASRVNSARKELSKVMRNAFPEA
jgi:RNA polymerase sigma-70 factor (ECF subfamily)